MKRPWVWALWPWLVLGMIGLFKAGVTWAIILSPAIWPVLFVVLPALYVMRERGRPARLHEQCLRSIADKEYDLPEYGPPWWHYKKEITNDYEYGQRTKYKEATIEDQTVRPVTVDPVTAIGPTQANINHAQAQQAQSLSPGNPFRPGAVISLDPFTQMYEAQAKMQQQLYELERPKRLKKQGVWLPGDPKETNGRETGNGTPP